MTASALNPALAGTPGYLVTLRDMLEFSLPAWLTVRETLARLQNEQDQTITLALAQDRAHVMKPLLSVAKGCLEMQLQFSYSYAADLIARVQKTPTLIERLNEPLPTEPNDPLLTFHQKMEAKRDGTETLTPELLRACIETLRRRIDDELVGRVFLSVDPLRIRFYREEYPFGEQVAEGFPLALTDSQEAAKCLALDRVTACVFHLIRVMEIGLKATAKALGVPHQNDWGHYIREINQKIAARKPTTKEERDEVAFYEGVVNHLHTIKKLWRNPFMHPDESCQTSAQAEAIFNTVRLFMEHLATRVSE